MCSTEQRVQEFILYVRVSTFLETDQVEHPVLLACEYVSSGQTLRNSLPTASIPAFLGSWRFPGRALEETMLGGSPAGPGAWSATSEPVRPVGSAA